VRANRRDPALWTHEQTAEWLERAAADATVGSQAAEMRSLPTALDGRMGGEASAGCAARVDAAAILSGGMTGLQLCAMPEPELHRRVMAQVMTAARASDPLFAGCVGLLCEPSVGLWVLVAVVGCG